jgi:hypothetical protein
MIDALQWIVNIGNFNIHMAVMTISGFCMAPRVGLPNRLRQIYGYLLKMKHVSSRVRTKKPDSSDLPDNVHDCIFPFMGR